MFYITRRKIVIKGIIFDLDETILNTISLKTYRDKRDWNSCYNNVHLTTIYEDLSEVFIYLHNKGFKVGIVTMSPKQYATKLLAYHDIQFDCLIAYHDVTKRKPDPEPMIKCAQKLGLETNELIGIGDDKRDIISANNAGILSVGVTWGTSTVQDLEEVHADFIINNFSELLNILYSF